MAKGLSKSRYTAFCQCPKLLWLKVYKPDEAPEFGAASAELNLFKFCRVVTNEDEVKN